METVIRPVRVKEDISGKRFVRIDGKIFIIEDPKITKKEAQKRVEKQLFKKIKRPKPSRAPRPPRAPRKPRVLTEAQKQAQKQTSRLKELKETKLRLNIFDIRSRLLEKSEEKEKQRKKTADIIDEGLAKMKKASDSKQLEAPKPDDDPPDIRVPKGQKQGRERIVTEEQVQQVGKERKEAAKVKEELEAARLSRRRDLFSGKLFKDASLKARLASALDVSGRKDVKSGGIMGIGSRTSSVPRKPIDILDAAIKSGTLTQVEFDRLVLGDIDTEFLETFIKNKFLASAKKTKEESLAAAKKKKEFEESEQQKISQMPTEKERIGKKEEKEIRETIKRKEEEAEKVFQSVAKMLEEESKEKEKKEEKESKEEISGGQKPLLAEVRKLEKEAKELKKELNKKLSKRELSLLTLISQNVTSDKIKDSLSRKLGTLAFFISGISGTQKDLIRVPVGRIISNAFEEDKLNNLSVLMKTIDSNKELSEILDRRKLSPQDIVKMKLQKQIAKDNSRLKIIFPKIISGVFGVEKDRRSFLKGAGYKQEGLSNFDIDEMMSLFGGFDDGFLGSFSREDPELEQALSTISIDELPKSFIINTVNSNKEGIGHWLAVQLTPDSVEFFDSNGEGPDQKIKKQLKKLIDDLDFDNLLKFKINRLDMQNPNSMACGFYAMRFLLARQAGDSFSKSTGFEDFLDAQRDVADMRDIAVEEFKLI